MLRDVEAVIRRQSLVTSGDRVVVALSGGADSVCLLHILHRLRERLGIRLVVAHLDHMIRGAESREDVAFARSYATELSVPFVTRRRNVPLRARRRGVSLEMAARELRYAFLLEVAEQQDARVIATGHTADDQVETLLLRLVRGSGPGGLAGIRRSQERCGRTIVRPLLDVRRVAIEAYLRRERVSWREDASNQDDAFLRNRVRHEVLPLLRERLNPRVDDSLLRLAQVMDAEDACLAELVSDLLARHVSGQGAGAQVLIDGLADQPSALVRRLLRHWLIDAGVAAERLGFAQVQAVEELLSKAGGSARVSVGSLTVKRSYDTLEVEAAGVDEPCERVFSVCVVRPGETRLPGDLLVSLCKREGVNRLVPGGVGRLPASASLSARRMGRRSLKARTWQEGDRIRPLGMKGSRKLQDIFVDQKVPVVERSRIPVFECDGEVVWIPGYRIAHGWQVRADERVAWQISVSRV